MSVNPVGGDIAASLSSSSRPTPTSNGFDTYESDPPYSPSNHGDSYSGTVFIVTLIFIILSFVAVFLRVIARAGIVRQMRLDDWLIVVAWLLSFGMCFAICFGTQYGFGDHLYNVPEKDRPTKNQCRYTFTLLYNPAIMVTKTSILVFYLLVFKVQRVFRILCWITMAVVNITGLALTLVLMFQCSPISLAWKDSIPSPHHCISTLSIYYASAPVNIITDLAILVLPLPVLTALRLPTKQKCILIGVFSLGLFVLAIGIVRIHYFQVAYNSSSSTSGILSNDFDYYAALSFMWAGLEVNIGIICASIPMMKPLASRFFPRFLSSGSTLGSRRGSRSQNTMIDRESGRGSHEHGHGGFGRFRARLGAIGEAPAWLTNDESCGGNIGDLEVMVDEEGRIHQGVGDDEYSPSGTRSKAQDTRQYSQATMPKRKKTEPDIDPIEALMLEKGIKAGPDFEDNEEDEDDKLEDLDEKSGTSLARRPTIRTRTSKLERMGMDFHGNEAEKHEPSDLSPNSNPDMTPLAADATLAERRAQAQKLKKMGFDITTNDDEPDPPPLSPEQKVAQANDLEHHSDQHSSRSVTPPWEKLMPEFPIVDPEHPPTPPSEKQPIEVETPPWEKMDINFPTDELDPTLTNQKRKNGDNSSSSRRGSFASPKSPSPTGTSKRKTGTENNAIPEWEAMDLDFPTNELNSTRSNTIRKSAPANTNGLDSTRTNTMRQSAPANTTTTSSPFPTAPSSASMLPPPWGTMRLGLLPDEMPDYAMMSTISTPTTLEPTAADTSTSRRKSSGAGANNSNSGRRFSISSALPGSKRQNSPSPPAPFGSTRRRRKSSGQTLNDVLREEQRRGSGGSRGKQRGDEASVEKTKEGEGEDSSVPPWERMELNFLGGSSGGAI